MGLYVFFKHSYFCVPKRTRRVRHKLLRLQPPSEMAFGLVTLGITGFFGTVILIILSKYLDLVDEN